MINYVQPGEALTLTTPSGGVLKGGVYLKGALLVVAGATVPETSVPFAAQVTGVFRVVKATGATWSEGQKIYWDVADNEFNTSSGGNILAGVAVEAVGSSVLVGKLRLDGVAR